MARTYKLRPINQLKCYRKALDKDKFLIAAKCRFGKTFVALEIAFQGWKSKKILVVSGFSNVEDEWKRTVEEQYPEQLDNFNFQTIQYLKVGSNKEDEIKKNKGCTLIFDEAHFGERTYKTQEIIKALEPTKVLYLSATPYTDSLAAKFYEANNLNGDNQFSYSIQDEFEDYFRDPKTFVKENKYTPVQLTLKVLQYNGVGRPITIEKGEKTKGTVKWTKEGWDNFKEELDSKGYKTFLYFVRDRKEASSVKKDFSRFPELKGNIYQLSGIENNSDEESTRKYFEDVNSATKAVQAAKQEGRYFAVIACKRGGTGITWKGLDCVCFYDAPNSVIDFIQKSYRCANPEEGKSEATVYCFDKESALNIYLATNRYEAQRKGIGSEENFLEFTKFFKLEGDFKTYDYGSLIQAVGRKFSWQLFDFSGIDLSQFNVDGFKETKKSTEGNSPEKSNTNKKQSESNKKDDNNNIKEKEEDDSKKKKHIFDMFKDMYEEIEYLSNYFNFDVNDSETYLDWVWKKIELKFDRDDWISLLSNNGKAVEIYLKNLKYEKETIDEKKKNEVKLSLKEKYKGLAYTKTVREIETRKGGLQAELRKWSLENIGLIYGKEGSKDVEYAHIIPFSNVKCTDDSFDPENGIMIPSQLHQAWDAEDIDFVVRDDNYLEVKPINLNSNHAELAKLYSISNRSITEGQREFFERRVK